MPLIPLAVSPSGGSFNIQICPQNTKFVSHIPNAYKTYIAYVKPYTPVPYVLFTFNFLIK